MGTHSMDATMEYRIPSNVQPHSAMLANGAQWQDTAGALGMTKDQAGKASLFESTKQGGSTNRQTDREKSLLASTTKHSSSSILDAVSDICHGMAKLGENKSISSISKQHRASIRPDEQDWIDVDKLNVDDPQSCSAYATAIMDTLRQGELVKKPNERYLEQVQPDITAKMRAILVDWLVEVSEEYKLCADTLYQAVSYIDRYLSLQVVQRNQLQLIGVTCMWLSSKYEEIYPPNVADFCYITDITYNKEQLIIQEEVVLKVLRYELTAPTAKAFLRRLLQVCNPDELLHFLSNYLTELSLLDYNMLAFLPSVIAAAGVYLANLMLQRQPWDATLRHYSDYSPSDIKRCVFGLASVHHAVSNSQQLPAIREKYSHPRFQQVSKIPPVSVGAYEGVYAFS